MKKWMMVVLLAGFCSLSQAAITGASATGSASGFGEISYTPGSNVDEFMIYGRTSSSAEYIRSSGTLHIAQGVSGDGQNSDDNSYDATTYSWSGGTPTASGTWNVESAQPTSTGNGWGLTPYTWASVTVTAPSDAFKFSFFVHCYYTTTDLEIWQDGSQIALYDNVMSSAYLDGGGEARNTDYFYQFNFTDITQGSALEFRFTGFENLGSSWANIGFLSAGLDYTAPTSIENNLTSMPNTIPEPATALILALGGGLIGLYRRFFGRM